MAQNTTATILSSAARTATINSADQTNRNHRGVTVYLNVTAVTATPSLVVKIQAKDPAGNYVDLLVGSAVATVSAASYTVYPGVTETANVDASTPLPRDWRVRVEHGDADSATYTVTAHLHS
jgi:hypothetical protein